MVAAAAGALALGLTIAGAAHAEPVVISGSAANAVNLQPTVDAFRAQLGAQNPNDPGSAAGGRREINWDAVADTGRSTVLPFNFFNVNSPRGVLLTSIDGAPGRVLVSSTAAGNERFRDVEPTYAGLFTAFSAPRLFGSQNSLNTSNDPSVDVLFRVPGSSTAATTNAFGAVFTSVSAPNRTFLQFFSADGRNLGSFPAPTGTLSFVGVRWNAGERIAMVRVRAGDIRLQSGIRETLPAQDLVAMDDFLYGEPQQLPIPGGGESFEGGLGGFVAAKLSGAPADPTFSVSAADAHTGSSSAFVPDPATLTDMTLTSPPVEIRTGGASTLTFFHRDASENVFDGGIVELSTDGGVTWSQPAPERWLENGPAVRISAGFSSPIAGSIAFSGLSAGFVRSVLDLTPNAGSTIRYRFRFASDISSSARGWFIDDVSVATPAPPPPPPPPVVTPPVVTPPVVRPPPTVVPPPLPPRGGELTALSLASRTVASGRSASVRYTLSGPANVSFTVTRSVAGRFARGRCKTAPVPRRGRRCTKTVTVKQLSARGLAGSNTVALALGRIAPGSYTLTASAGGSVKTTTLTVTRARARARRGRRRR